jgi:protocatechuate 3,4-dioxygenase beta subunit
MKQIMHMLATLIMVVVVQSALGQELTLRGTVLSSANEPLPNATVHSGMPYPTTRVNSP